MGLQIIIALQGPMYRQKLDYFSAMKYCRFILVTFTIHMVVERHLLFCKLKMLHKFFTLQLLFQCREKSLFVEPEASLLIKNYFVASRRARSLEGAKGIDMPLKALKTL